jgi:exopolyphosphatase/guanosine-5'-triphosphate,3'-diphosphate pyrophosphatase
MHRYTNKREGTRFTPMLRLLDDKELHTAEVVGKAMRFGAMLWLQGAPLGEMRWFPKKKVLELWLSKEAEPLFGEVAEARFNSLANTLGAQSVVKIRRERAQIAPAPEDEK